MGYSMEIRDIQSLLSIGHRKSKNIPKIFTFLVAVNVLSKA